MEHIAMISKNDSKEEWRPVVGYLGMYEVSDHGRVKSLDRVVRHNNGGPRRVRERILRPAPGEGGRLSVSLSYDGAATTRYIHRLVIEAFVSPCPEGMECCHWDGDPANNRLENLRWDSHHANLDDKIRHGTDPQGERNGKAILAEVDIRSIWQRLKAGNETNAAIAADFGVTPSNISVIKRGCSWGWLTSTLD